LEVCPYFLTNFETKGTELGKLIEEAKNVYPVDYLDKSLAFLNILTDLVRFFRLLTGSLAIFKTFDLLEIKIL